jgi:hypothetical protein
MLRVGKATDDNITRRMRFACWTKRLQTHTHTEYVIFIPTMVTRTPLTFPSHVQRVSLFLQAENRLNASIVTVRLSVLCSYNFGMGKEWVSNIASETGYSEFVMISVSTCSKCGDIDSNWASTASFSALCNTLLISSVTCPYVGVRIKLL